ncbi:hypothetical protein ANAPH2_01203 [Anaplasma phagocytophilum]|nr:hypothetical protein ANAPH2_01203 [Anaplasma phagocytophilum]
MRASSSTELAHTNAGAEVETDVACSVESDVAG